MKRVPQLKSDQEAEDFLAEDQSDLDFSQFRAGQLRFAPKMADLNMRLPEQTVAALKRLALGKGVSVAALLAELIDRELAQQ